LTAPISRQYEVPKGLLFYVAAFFLFSQVMVQLILGQGSLFFLSAM
jgi:hypothetical protein